MKHSAGVNIPHTTFSVTWVKTDVPCKCARAAIRKSGSAEMAGVEGVVACTHFSTCMAWELAAAHMICFDAQLIVLWWATWAVVGRLDLLSILLQCFV